MLNRAHLSKRTIIGDGMFSIEFSINARSYAGTKLELLESGEKDVVDLRDTAIKHMVEACYGGILRSLKTISNEKDADKRQAHINKLINRIENTFN